MFCVQGFNDLAHREMLLDVLKYFPYQLHQRERNTVSIARLRALQEQLRKQVFVLSSMYCYENVTIVVECCRVFVTVHVYFSCGGGILDRQVLSHGVEADPTLDHCAPAGAKPSLSQGAQWTNFLCRSVTMDAPTMWKC